MQPLRFARGTEADNLVVPLLGPLFNDLVECEELRDKNDTQFVRRVFVRCAFAYLEAHIYWLRQQVTKWLTIGDIGPISHRAASLALLQDEAFRPDERGKLKPQINRVPFTNLCAFTLRIAAEYWQLDADPFFSDPGWAELQNAVKVRDPITHPKRDQDPIVQDKEDVSLREGLRWFLNRVIDIVNASQRLLATASGIDRQQPTELKKQPR